MWGQIIQAVAGAVDNRRQTNKANRHNIETRKEAKRQFNQQMNETVQRRVKDAQQAGIHPLFAMGGSAGASPTVSTGGYAQAQPSGSGIGDALGAIVSLIESTTKEKDTNSRVNEVDAQIKASQLARMQNWASAQGRDQIGTANAPDGTPSFPIQGEAGQVETLTSQVTSHNPDRPAEEAGLKTPYVRYKRADGSTGLAFGSDVPGAEELNMIWIPLQNWWHTSKEARQRLRETIGLSGSQLSRLQSDPEYARRYLERNKHLLVGPKLKRFFKEAARRYGRTQPPKY